MAAGVAGVAPSWTVPASVTSSIDGEIGRTQTDRVGAVASYNGYPTREQAEADIARRELALLSLTGSQLEASYVDKSGVINQQQALLDLQRGQLGASYADQQRVFAANRALQVARTAEYQLQVRQLEEKRSELLQINAAEDNVANKAGIAAARRDASVYDTRYGMAGLQVQEIQRPLDGSADQNLPPGVRYALETDAERLGRQFQRTAADRGLALEGAGLNTTNAGLNVNAASMTQAERDAARAKQLAGQQYAVAGSQINLNRNDLEREMALERQRIALDKSKIGLANPGLTSIYGAGGSLYG